MFEENSDLTSSENKENTNKEDIHQIYSKKSSVSQSTEIHETKQLPGNLSQDVHRRKRPRSNLNVLRKTWLSDYQIYDVVLAKVPNYWWLAGFVKYKDDKMLIVQIYPFTL